MPALARPLCVCGRFGRALAGATGRWLAFVDRARAVDVFRGKAVVDGHCAGLGNPVPGMFRGGGFVSPAGGLLIAKETGLFSPGSDGAITAMDDLARAVLLEEIVRRLRTGLRVFAGVADRPGFIEKLDGTLRELRQHGHSAASLRAMVDSGQLRGEAGGGGGGGDVAIEIAGLGRSSRGVGGGLRAAGGGWDYQSLLHQAAGKVGECGWIAGGDGGQEKTARVWGGMRFRRCRRWRCGCWRRWGSMPQR